ncbi:exonuclease 1 [Geosmithia morbida]|uniref:Exonuclease 1 n=1 Tax=Geosmithia morbida TaxID=1094350 RepID=A0A9P5D4I0_9HYPO|nr:exonuclease 1 [Geosmithia morbida]KAF4126062.1 exonuclease 1 [Geosmithia morbida]
MGVSGLLPLLKSIQRPTEVKNFRGQTLGIDGYGWLHRAAYSCAVELGQGKPTDKYVTACMHRIRLLCQFGVKPYMVFDGDYLPSKAATEDARAKSRDEKKKAALGYIKAGKPSLAAQEFQKCIDVTPEMAASLIHQLKKINVPYVVAPYEADAQLVYLERKGLIDGIISDDSDLLVFGAKRLLTKMDRYGACIEINRRDFCACREVSLTGWSDADFRRMAILSGCDYLDGLPSVGLKTAYRMLRTSKTPEKVVRMLQFQGKRISENYLTQFYQAELTFLHQWVYCPEAEGLVHLTELDGTRTAEEMPFIGAYVEKSLAQAIAKAEVNPITKAPITIAVTPSKRRHSQAATSTASATASATAVPSQPSTKPIKSYFKSHQRIPMGSMDTNCFAVDPERVAQLTDGGLVPRVFPLPRPYLDQPSTLPSSGSARRPDAGPTRNSPRIHRRRTEPISNMLSDMGHNSKPSKPISTNLTGGSAPSSLQKTENQTRPPKKARLCEDAAEQDGSPKQSKFFGAKEPTRRSPRRARSDAYLLSDDSINEALVNLPDIDGFRSPKCGKPISVFDESSQDVGVQGSSRGPSQEAAGETVPEASLQQQLSPSPDRMAMPPPKSTSRLSAFAHTPSRSTNIRRFSYNSAAPDTPASAATSTVSSVFSAGSTPGTAPSTGISSVRPTPLQRLGNRALSASYSPKPRKTTPSKQQPRGVGDVPVNPSFVPLPKVDLKELEALHRSNGGSEDQIVPDSDEDDEGDDAELEAAPLTKLNLSRFSFKRV